MKDILMQSAGLVSMALAVLLTIGGAAALGTLTGQYGLFGWLVFLILMACWFMFAVPFIVTATALRKAGSPRHRREKAERVAAQARRYGLDDVRPVDDEPRR